MSRFSMVHHPLPFIISLLFASYSLQTFNFYVPETIFPKCLWLGLSPTQCFICECVSVSLRGRSVLCMCQYASMRSCHCLLSALAILEICCHANSTYLNWITLDLYWDGDKGHSRCARFSSKKRAQMKFQCMHANSILQNLVEQTTR